MIDKTLAKSSWVVKDRATLIEPTIAQKFNGSTLTPKSKEMITDEDDNLVGLAFFNHKVTESVSEKLCELRKNKSKFKK